MAQEVQKIKSKEFSIFNWLEKRYFKFGKIQRIATYHDPPNVKQSMHLTMIITITIMNK